MNENLFVHTSVECVGAQLIEGDSGRKFCGQSRSLHRFRNKLDWSSDFIVQIDVIKFIVLLISYFLPVTHCQSFFIRNAEPTLPQLIPKFTSSIFKFLFI